jgi:hypothetical protein
MEDASGTDYRNLSVRFDSVRLLLPQKTPSRSKYGVAETHGHVRRR